MRILHVVPTYIPAWRYGGPIHSVHGLCAGLVRRGHAVAVATTNIDGPVESDVPVGVPVDLDGVSVHYFPSKRLRRLCYSPLMLSFLRQSAQTVDLIHTHSVFLWPTSAAAHVARRARIPYVVSPRGMLVRDLIKRRNAMVKRAWITLLERRNIREAVAVHSTSSLETEEMLALGLHPKRVFELPNGIDPLLVQWMSPSLVASESRPYILFLGRINWKKGLDRLFSALAIAPGVRAIIAGNDEEGYLAKLRQLATALSISNRIHYAGYIHGEAKIRLISEARALVLTSYSESFGNVLVEAMAQATPVVVTPEVGLAKFITENQCGLVSAGSPDELSAAILALWSNAGLRAMLGANGKRAARIHFSWESIAKGFEENYRAALSK